MTAILHFPDLEHLSFMKVESGSTGGEPRAARWANFRLMNDDLIRRGDLPQSYAVVTDLFADL